MRTTGRNGRKSRSYDSAGCEAVQAPPQDSAEILTAKSTTQIAMRQRVKIESAKLPNSAAGRDSASPDGEPLSIEELNRVVQSDPIGEGYDKLFHGRELQPRKWPRAIEIRKRQKCFSASLQTSQRQRLRPNLNDRCSFRSAGGCVGGGSARRKSLPGMASRTARRTAENGLRSI